VGDRKAQFAAALFSSKRYAIDPPDEKEAKRSVSHQAAINRLDQRCSQLTCEPVVVGLG